MKNKDIKWGRKPKIVTSNNIIDYEKVSKKVKTKSNKSITR